MKSTTFYAYRRVESLVHKIHTFHKFIFVFKIIFVMCLGIAHLNPFVRHNSKFC